VSGVIFGRPLPGFSSKPPPAVAPPPAKSRLDHLLEGLLEGDESVRCAVEFTAIGKRVAYGEACLFDNHGSSVWRLEIRLRHLEESHDLIRLMRAGSYLPFEVVFARAEDRMLIARMSK